MPQRLTKETMQSFTSKVVDNSGEPLWSRVRFDLGPLTFIDPTGVVVMCNLVDYLRRVGVKVRVKVSKPFSECVQYLDDFGFFKHYGGESLRPNAILRKTTVPIERVQSHRLFAYL